MPSKSANTYGNEGSHEKLKELRTYLIGDIMLMLHMVLA